MGIKWIQKTAPAKLAVKYGSSLRTPPALRWFLLVLLLSIPLLYLIYELSAEYIMVRFSGLVIYDTVEVRAPDSGYIKKLYVKPGVKVRDNQPLLLFISPLLEERLNYLLKEKKRILELRNSLGDDNSEQMLQALEVAKEDIDASKAVYERFKDYTRKGDMIELQLEEARKNYVEAQRAYIAIDQKNDEFSLQRKTLIEVNFVRKILELENEIEQIKIKMHYFNMLSPENGTVMNITTHEDEFVSSGQSLVNIVTDKNLRIIAFIDPKYMEDIYQGKEVSIIFPNHESKKGQIINTPSYAEKTPLSQINPLATPENKLIILIKPNSPIQKKYQVFGIPVKIKLD